MGGTLDLCLRFFAGLNILSDKISLSPKLPEHWKKMKFQVRYRNIWFSFLITHDSVTVKADPVGGRLSLQRAAAIPIEINKNVYELRPRKAQEISF
jgi:trehalose/maltose hydrolase-like predicted phosphorylase